MTEIPGGYLALLGIFALGLGLNLTPCVYPMMSVTLSILGAQKETHHGRAFAKSLLYVLGIATMYSSLGVAAALTGEIFGTLLQNPFVLLGIALLLAGLALSMFGLYTFQMPSWLLNKVGGQRKANLLGIYLSGLFVGVFAAPCIGPPIIALLTFVGTRKDPVFAFWIFFVMSLGLGTPYLIFGTFSGLLHRLPKAGVWLMWVEHLFGVILLAFAFFYGLLAVQPALLKWWLPANLAAGGIYLGFLEKSGNRQSKFQWLKRSLGAAAIIAGVLISFSGPRQSVQWELYTPGSLAAAQEAGRPVVMDFFADWCIPCHELDQFTYSDERVIQALEGYAKIKVDLTNPDTEEINQLIEKFEIVGVPTVLILVPQGDEIKEARITGFIGPDDFLMTLRSPRVREAAEANSDKSSLKTDLKTE